MDRRTFLAIATGALATPLAAEAQQTGKVWRVGVLSAPPGPYFPAFEQGLRELGYVRGQNIQFESRSLGPRIEHLPEAAADLVRLNVHVIVTGPDRFIDAARQATTTVPIVMVYGTDPVARGYVASLARPGGNITGLTWDPSPEIYGKHIELLAELSPRPTRVAVVVDPANPDQASRKEVDNAAKHHGVTLQYVEVRGSTLGRNRSSDFGADERSDTPA